MNTLKPPRGKQASAESQNIVLEKGGVFFEVPSSGEGTGYGNIKIGDGETTYKNLPYFMKDNTEAVSILSDSIDSIIDGSTKVTSATSATYASTATKAGTATYATNAGTSNYAINSGTSTYATKATSATSAVYAAGATTASKATSATSATYATTATKAGTSTYATNAGTSSYSSSSAKASSATSATYASGATTASKATSATSATYATTATNSGTSTYAKSVASHTHALANINAGSSTNAYQFYGKTKFGLVQPSVSVASSSSTYSGYYALLASVTLTSAYASYVSTFILSEAESTGYATIFQWKVRNGSSATTLSNNLVTTMAATDTTLNGKLISTYVVDSSSITYRLYLQLPSTWRTYYFSQFNHVSSNATINSITYGSITSSSYSTSYTGTASTNSGTGPLIKSNGKLTENVTIYNSSASKVSFEVTNSYGTGTMQYSASGNFGLYHSTSDYWVIRYGTDSKIYLGPASGACPVVMGKATFTYDSTNKRLAISVS